MICTTRIRPCEFATITSSSSLNTISFAVLYKKPILFFTTDQLNNYDQDIDYKRLADDWAALLGYTVVNISKELYKIRLNYNVDEQLYKNYVNEYIKIDGADDASHPQIICKAIKKYWNDYSTVKHNAIARKKHESV